MIDDRESLRDLPCVGVVVEHFRSVAEDAGFDEQVFRTDVELRLRMAGICVLENFRPSWLYLNANVLHRERDRAAAFSISLELKQEVILQSRIRSDPRNLPEDALAGATMFAPTWSVGAAGFGTVADVRDAVRDLVDKFANDWLAANPLNGKT